MNRRHRRLMSSMPLPSERGEQLGQESAGSWAGKLHEGLIRVLTGVMEYFGCILISRTDMIWILVRILFDAVVCVC